MPRVAYAASTTPIPSVAMGDIPAPEPRHPAWSEEPITFGLLFLWAKVKWRWVSAGDMYLVGKFDEG